MRHLLLLVLLLAIAGSAYWFLAPAEVNGDGVGYLRRVDGVGLSPGHLAYLPLSRQVAAFTGHRVLFDLVAPLRFLSIGCALLSLAFLFDAGRRAHGPGPALFATALLASSFAFARSAMEVEVYAVSTLMAVALLWALVRYAECAGTLAVGWAALAGVFCGAGILFHLTLVLLGPPMALLLIRWGRLRIALLAVGVTAVVVLVPLLAVLRRAGVTDLEAGVSWLLSSDHGIPYPRPLLGPVIAVWGAIRSLLFVPYPYESTLPVVVALSVSGGAAWLLLLVLRRRAPPGRRLDGAFVLIWCLPLALFAAFFFPSDTERWIFLLPAVFLWLAPARGRLAYAVVALLAAANVVGGFLPAALDREPAERAAAVDRLATARDLVVSPGHGWEEMVGLRSKIPPATFPLIYHVGAEEDLDAAVRDMRDRIRRTLAAGGRVFVARLRDSPDPRGFKELLWFGMGREDFADLFAEYEIAPTTLPELWELRRR